jgi:hypothetical protein
MPKDVNPRREQLTMMILDRIAPAPARRVSNSASGVGLTPNWAAESNQANRPAQGNLWVTIG